MPFLSQQPALNTSLPVSEANVTNLTTDLGTLTTAVAAKVAKATLTAKGDIYVATASGGVTRLPVGADGTVLTADSNATPGIKWA